MKENLKEAFWNKLTAEYKSYQVSVLALSNFEIYGKCYEIDCMVNFYEIMMEKAESLSEKILSALLKRGNFLSVLYDEWLVREDSSYHEMETHILNEIELVAVEYDKQKEAEKRRDRFGK